MLHHPSLATVMLWLVAAGVFALAPWLGSGRDSWGVPNLSGEESPPWLLALGIATCLWMAGWLQPGSP